MLLSWKPISISYFRPIWLVSSVLIFFSSLGSCLGIGDLSLEEKIGQVFLVGVSGQQLTAATESHLSEIKPGGILLFKRNILNQPQLLRLTSALQSKSKIPLLIAVDQEGGLVTRLKTIPSLPSARWVGSANDPALTEQLGQIMGTIMRKFGINMNLAPVLDVDTAGSETFLKSRTYSDNPDVVGNLGLAFSQGLLNSGVIPTAKHFPGLGSVTGDPHAQKVKQTSSYKEMQAKHLAPYRKYCQLYPAGIMLSHAKYPSLGASEPAPYSTQITKNLLQNDLGYKGLIITDDLMMTGASDSTISFQDKVIKVFNSGSDILLIAWSTASQKMAYKALQNGIKNKQISIEDLNAKVEKILAVKSWLSEKEKVRSLASDSVIDLKNVIDALALVRAHSAARK